MVQIRAVLEGVQKGVNFFGPYILGNIAVAATIHGGQEAWAGVFELPKNLEDYQFYAGLGAFNLGVLVPSIQGGPMNYVRDIFNKTKDSAITLHPHAKTFLLGSALAVGIANDSVRESSRDALEKIRDDVSTVLHYKKKKDVPRPEAPKPVTVTVSQPGIGEGDQSLEDVLQAAHDSWRKLPYPGLKGQMYSRPRGVEDWAICATDLRTGEYLVDFNCDRQQMVASANKIPIMIAYFHQVKEGKLQDDQEKTLEKMIRESHNPSTNNILALIGNGNSSRGALLANDILKSYGFPQTAIEAIPGGGRTLGNKSTAGELNTMLAWIYNPSLNPDEKKRFPYSQKMKRILGLDSLPGHSNRLTDGEDNCIPTDPSYMEHPVGAYVTIFDKTGYLKGANVNSAVIEAHFKTDKGDLTVPYALTLAVQDVQAKQDKVFGNGDLWGGIKSKQMRQDSQIIFWRLYKKYTEEDYACGYHNGVHPHEF